MIAKVISARADLCRHVFRMTERVEYVQQTTAACWQKHSGCMVLAVIA